MTSGNDSAPQVSVIIPTYNGSERIGACLQALSEQQTETTFEIIVVDDGSQHSPQEEVDKYENARLIRQENAGPAAARNFGVEHANGEIILFTDDDCVPQPDWIEKMLAPLANPAVAASKGLYLSKQTELTARFVQAEYEEKYDRMNKHESIDLVDTYSAAFRKNVFLENNGYRTSFSTASAEDREFSRRLAEKGYQLALAEEAKVWHTHIASPAGYFSKKFKNGYWIILCLLLNPDMARGTSDTPFTQKAQIILTAIFPFSFAALIAGSYAIALPTLLALAFILSCLPLTMRCLTKDGPTLAVCAPFFITCRAVALTSGLIYGILDTNRMREKI